MKFLTIFTVLIFCVSCAQINNLSGESATVQLSIDQAKPTGRPGVFAVTGSTNLPDETEVDVSAIRYFQPKQLGAPDVEGDPIYSILTRQLTKVNKGKWEAMLSLWQVAPDGYYVEAWQLNSPELQKKFQSAAGVTFLATLDPVNLPPKLKAELEQQDKRFAGSLVRFTPEGEQYLQASLTLNGVEPRGKTSPQPVSAIEKNYGWGDRYRTTNRTAAENVKVTTPATEDLTNAPLNREEFLR